jgi:hypothetical protein
MPGAVAKTGAFTGPTNRTPRHKTAKQQTATPTPGDAPLAAFASAEEMSHLPKLQGKQQKRRKGGGKRAIPSSAFVSAEEMSPSPKLQGNRRQERERGELRANDKEEDTSLDEEMRPGAVAGAGVFTGPTGPSVLSEPRGPYAKEPSLIIAKLAEPYQEDKELRRRNQKLEQEDKGHRQQNQELEKKLEKIVNETVLGTAIVYNSGAGDHDKNAAPSPFGRKGIRFLIGAALALVLLVVGVILGVAIPLTTNIGKDSPSIDSVLTPTQAPAPTKVPTAAPTACTSGECLLGKILLQNEVLGAKAFRDDSSPQV